MKSPGNDPTATRQDQARFVLELLVDLGGAASWSQLRDHCNLQERQIREALVYLASHGYLSCRTAVADLHYGVTNLGMDAVDLLQDLDAHAAG